MMFDATGLDYEIRLLATCKKSYFANNTGGFANKGPCLPLLVVDNIEQRDIYSEVYSDRPQVWIMGLFLLIASHQFL